MYIKKPNPAAYDAYAPCVQNVMYKQVQMWGKWEGES